MSIAVKASRTQVWLENLGEWTWPGQRATLAAEALPPPWVPSFPARREPVGLAAGAAGAAGATVGWRSRRTRVRRVILGLLLGALVSVCIALAHGGQLTLEGIFGVSGASAVEQEAPAIGSAPASPSLPTLDLVSQDAAGSLITRASYPSAALHGEGSFLVYLPSGYDATTAHYPVLYMLPGDDQSDGAFLQIGLQSQLDELIATHTIPPLIAVMIQGGPGANLWRNAGGLDYESYVLEVQELIDRMLPTIPARAARAIVGDSMGGYGAMNAALANPYRFGVVESWIGFFNGLEGDVRADRPIFERLGLHAFVYGAEQDHIANPAEDLPFAQALRADGAEAQGAIYPGEHNLETVEAHLGGMLVFAGHALWRAQRQAPAQHAAHSS
ncbi:MAG TPA: alpha/beta hydrolase-fold protein [Solirubrobacteraceae bacterium]|nr:alpha/beta hydrolase-fold protein [Solirubrobacteraceae bacterium]